MDDILIIGHPVTLILDDVSVSVVILANNALRAHHASAHGGVSTNGLLNICLNVF